MFSVFSVPKLLLLQSYKIISISPNFAWLKLAKIHQETALKLLKNIKFTALARCQYIARLRIVAFQENCEVECYAVTVLRWLRSDGGGNATEVPGSVGSVGVMRMYDIGVRGTNVGRGYLSMV